MEKVAIFVGIGHLQVFFRESLSKKIFFFFVCVCVCVWGGGGGGGLSQFWIYLFYFLAGWGCKNLG